ncbi:ankyrin repeat, SAM and basic leucine zipper domain-containing protein 1 isoform X1 [Hydra vulgaris]|uniref:ankyrin repeat, SAM and basic leucine zipper domain-containing protein 1 isoform X1 n=1 Tax=Hydra vulgaris TaxID=6087 RepID=UPI001F5F31D0|nr:ankyrin repeat, SAM and basic leucine zipper domain-containing protein 1 [Hydra vulgaris]
MQGIPAGFEDYSSDEDIDVEEIFEVSSPKTINYTQEINQDISTKTSIFTQKASFENVSEKISFEVEEMRIAVLKNDVGRIKELFSNGFKVDKLLPSGWSVLMYAANYGSIEAVKILLEEKSNVNFDCDMFTPLMAACYSTKATEEKLLGCVEALVHANAHIDSHDRYLMTALMYASKQGYSKIVDFLCKSGASVNYQDTRGWTALCFASRHGHSHVAKVLLQHNANHLLTAFDGQTPADIAFTYNYKIMSELLEKYNGCNIDQFKDVPSNGSNCNTAQSKYVKYGDLELFLHGLEMGHLVILFQEHNLNFTDMLKMTEEEMIEIGITQLGIRKKLIDAIRTVHTNEWEMSSLSMEAKHKLTLLECASVIANVSKHLKCIQSSVAYVKRQMKPNQLEFQSDHVNLQAALVEQCTFAEKITEELNYDIKELHQISLEMFQSTGEKPPEVIQMRVKNELPSFYRRMSLALIGSVIVVGSILVIYKHSSTHT